MYKRVVKRETRYEREFYQYRILLKPTNLGHLDKLIEFHSSQLFFVAQYVTNSKIVNSEYYCLKYTHNKSYSIQIGFSYHNIIRNEAILVQFFRCQQ